MTEDLGSLDVVNLGFGGGTFLSGIHYLDHILTPLKPRRMALYFGENDIASGGLTAQTTFGHFTELRERISQRLPETRVFVLGIKPSPALWIYQPEFSRFNALVRDWCEMCDGTEWIDPSAGLIGENGLPMFRFYLPDSVHMDGLFVANDGTSVPAPAAPSSANGKPTTIGIRPEDLSIVPETTVILTGCGTRLSAVLKERSTLKPGETVRRFAEPSKFISSNLDPTAAGLSAL